MKGEVEEQNTSQMPDSLFSTTARSVRSSLKVKKRDVQTNKIKFWQRELLGIETLSP